MSKIKWGCVQPLTGGMYLGAEKAIGNSADWIISYPGLTDFVYDKEGKVVDAGNERNIVDYLVKVNRMPSYYTMNRTMMQDDNDLNPVLTEVTFDNRELSNFSTTDLYSNTDIVVGVPVCAGLSMGSTANQDRKDECNCQMKWMAKYVLNTIKPKVYIFENAPTLMSGRGDSVRADLEQIAQAAGYSTIYYKTDTKYHHNCQKRPRTFILFFNNRDGKTFLPNLGYEHNNMSLTDFFNELQTRDNDPMNVTLPNYIWVDNLIRYVNHRFGNNWRNEIKRDLFDFIIRDKSEREPFMKWLNENCDEKTYDCYNRYLNHIDEKLTDNKGWWAVTAKYFGDCLPACMYKNMPLIVHHNEDRLYTMREWLWSMGHPADFDMTGEPWNYFRKIGQNVPVNTAKWVTSEALRIVNNWDVEPNCTLDDEQRVAFFDNTKRKQIW